MPCKQCDKGYIVPLIDLGLFGEEGATRLEHYICGWACTNMDCHCGFMFDTETQSLVELAKGEEKK